MTLAALLLLAALSLGRMDSAVRLEFKLSDPNGQALSLDPGQEKIIKIPQKIISRGGIWEARISCRSAKRCEALSLKVNRRIFKPARVDQGQVYFLAAIPPPMPRPG